jgi:hypothetical protein
MRVEPLMPRTPSSSALVAPVRLRTRGSRAGAGTATGSSPSSDDPLRLRRRRRRRVPLGLSSSSSTAGRLLAGLVVEHGDRVDDLVGRGLGDDVVGRQLVGLVVAARAAATTTTTAPARAVVPLVVVGVEPGRCDVGLGVGPDVDLGPAR